MKSFENLFPQAGENRKKVKSDAERKREEEEAKLFSLIDSVFSSENGEKVLKILKDKCRYQIDNCHFTSQGEHLPDILYRYEAQRAIYLFLRRYVNRETLKRVEIGD